MFPAIGFETLATQADGIVSTDMTGHICLLYTGKTKGSVSTCNVLIYSNHFTSFEYRKVTFLLPFWLWIC